MKYLLHLESSITQKFESSEMELRLRKLCVCSIQFDVEAQNSHSNTRLTRHHHLNFLNGSDISNNLSKYLREWKTFFLHFISFLFKSSQCNSSISSDSSTFTRLFSIHCCRAIQFIYLLIFHFEMSASIKHQQNSKKEEKNRRALKTIEILS